MVLCSPLSCLMEYCRSNCVCPCVYCMCLYVCFLRVCLFSLCCVAVVSPGANSPAMRNAPQHGSTSKPLHVHIHLDTHRLGQYGCTHKQKNLLHIQTHPYARLPYNSELVQRMHKEGPSCIQYYLDNTLKSH